MEKELRITDASRDALSLASAMEQSVDSAEGLETVMKKVQSTVRTTVKHVRRFLADFDELQRLPDKEVTVTATVKNDETQLAEGITDGSLAYRIRQVTAELRSLFSGLYQQMDMTNHKVQTTDHWMRDLHQKLLSAGNYLQANFLPVLEKMRQAMSGLMGPAVQVQQLLQGQASGLSALYRSVEEAVLPTLKGLTREFQTLGQQQNLLEPLRIRWSSHWNAMAQAVRQSANDMIRYCNGLMAAVAKTVNTVGKFSAALPGSTYKPVQVTPPKIPALAQGAVLPANRPFLAMVGDQRHGTNIEAPLTTIQEAVAAVTADQTGAIVAGFEASVGVQREILEAVLGISIGDETVANACRRYEQKMAVVRGG